MASAVSAASSLSLPPLLAGWLRKHGLEFSNKLAHVFSEEELLDGSAACGIMKDMHGDHGLTDEVGQYLVQLVGAAEVDGTRECRRLAAIPTRQIAAAAAQKRMTEQREREAARVEAAVLCQKARCKPPPPSRPRYGTGRQLAWAGDGDSRGRERSEAAEQSRWAERLREHLVQLGAPIVGKVSGSRDPARTLLLALGGRRASTIRARVREWARYCQWLRRTRDLPPPIARHVLHRLSH